MPITGWQIEAAARVLQREQSRRGEGMPDWSDAVEAATAVLVAGLANEDHHLAVEVLRAVLDGDHQRAQALARQVHGTDREALAAAARGLAELLTSST